MVVQNFKSKTKELIDNLKGICANYGLGNDGNEFKIITQIFLYKFMNDKFGYEVKELNPKLKTELMKTGQNFNHPKPGSKISVEPIRELKDIRSIKRLLHDNPRDLALFVVGINTNLRASDLCEITVGQVKDLKAGDELVLNERKTGKERRINLNKDCVNVIQKLTESLNSSRRDDSQLFRGRQGDIDTVGVNYLVKKFQKKWKSLSRLPKNSKPFSYMPRSII